MVKRRFFPIWDPLADPNGQSRRLYDDFNGGPPSDLLFDQSHITVVDAATEVTYFDGIVSVGDFFNVTSLNGATLDKVTITTRTPDQKTILQVVRDVSTSCSTRLELHNLFGAFQIVGYENEEQGTISSSFIHEFSRNIEVPVSAVVQENTTVQVVSLLAKTNFAGDINLTNQVVGIEVVPGNAQDIVSFEGTIDTSFQRTYRFEFII